MGEPEVPHYKCLIIGDGGTGKSAFIKRHLTGGFEKKYKPTMGVEVSRLDFFTTRGPISFDIWDTSGHEKFSCLRDAYYIKGQCAVITFDLTSLASYKKVRGWAKDLSQVCQNIPVVVCGYKADVENHRKVDPKSRTFNFKNNYQYYEISSKSNYNFEKPFLWLARSLTGDASLKFVPMPAYPPEDVEVNDPELWTQLEKECNEAMTIPLPDDD